MAEKTIDIKYSEKQKGNIQKTKQESIFKQIDTYLADKGSVKTQDKVLFFRLLSAMINSSMPLIEALEVLKDQMKSPKLALITQKLLDKVAAGETLSESMKQFPEVFTGAEIGVIKAGEKSGKLNKILLNLSSQVEKSAAITGKIKGAMIYPIVILFIVFSAVYAIMIMVIPKIKDMFVSMGAELPFMTQFLIDTSDFLTGTNETLGVNNSILIFCALGIIASLVIYAKKTPKGAYYFDIGLLKFPLFGTLFQKMAMAKFCAALNILIGSGVSVLESLSLSSEMIGSEAYKIRIHRIKMDVQQGLAIAQNIKNDTTFFPSMVVAMISVGEKTAQLENVTLKVAEFYEDEVDTMVRNMMSLIEPFIIVVVGGIVAGIVVAVMMPIMSLTDLVA